jgi:hypothetical protein
MLGDVMTRLHNNDERGAVAVIVSILAVALFAFGALAVDLGNAFARKRVVQTQADLAALAGAAELPGDPTAAVETAFDYLQRNSALGGPEAWTLEQFTDGSEANGEITPVQANTRLRVVAPPATVDYALAGVIGFDSGDVQAEAEAAVLSPRRTLPFFIPSGCVSTGPIVLKAGATASTGPTYFSPSGKPPQTPQVNAVTPLQLQHNVSGQQLTVLGDNYSDSGTDADVTMQVGFVRGATQVGPIDVTAADVTLNVSPVLDELVVTVPDEVTSTLGVWFVQVKAAGGTRWSEAENSDEAGYAFTVGDVTSLPDECGEKQTGDFGLLDSPRATDAGAQITQAQQRLDLNISKGIDHSLQTFSGTLPAYGAKDNCRMQPANVPILGGRLDEFSTRDGANCMNIFNGNKVDSTTDGLITGGNQPEPFDGRLVAETTPGCAPDGTDSERVVAFGNKSFALNNDVLSCYLRAGNLQSLGTASDDERLLGEVIDSPRLFFVPVLHTPANPPNGFYPIVGWRAVFITDESVNASKGSSDATESNGVEVGSSKMTSLTVFQFDIDQLPEVVDTGGETMPYMGAGPKVVRLVR